MAAFGQERRMAYLPETGPGPGQYPIPSTIETGERKPEADISAPPPLKPHLPPRRRIDSGLSNLSRAKTERGRRRSGDNAGENSVSVFLSGNLSGSSSGGNNSSTSNNNTNSSGTGGSSGNQTSSTHRDSGGAGTRNRENARERDSSSVMSSLEPLPLRQSRMVFKDPRRDPTNPSCPAHAYIQPLLTERHSRSTWLRLQPMEEPGPVLLRSREHKSDPAMYAPEISKVRPKQANVVIGKADRFANVYLSYEHHRRQPNADSPGQKYMLPQMELESKHRSAPAVAFGPHYIDSVGPASSSPTRPSTSRVYEGVGPGAYDIKGEFDCTPQAARVLGGPQGAVPWGTGLRFFEPGKGVFISKRHARVMLGAHGPGPKYNPANDTVAYAARPKTAPVRPFSFSLTTEDLVTLSSQQYKQQQQQQEQQQQTNGSNGTNRNASAGLARPQTISSSTSRSVQSGTTAPSSSSSSSTLSSPSASQLSSTKGGMTRPMTPPLGRPSTARNPLPLRPVPTCDRGGWLHAKNTRLKGLALTWALPIDPSRSNGGAATSRLASAPSQLYTSSGVPDARIPLLNDVKRAQLLESTGPGPARYKLKSQFEMTDRQRRQLQLARKYRKQELNRMHNESTSSDSPTSTTRTNKTSTKGPG